VLARGSILSVSQLFARVTYVMRIREPAIETAEQAFEPNGFAVIPA
jgi:hypothetical protein